ncbi:PREDICTED: probable E3 ubiquitin-protein ligase LUL4 [Camelina sativa]|uniref:RING-type E3 ubiquitin transferase n=1 Tax=Camelina sativa TaxID=90675 RepID=A0ABM0XHK2_CAMSA|nr:PREDICTED: probable E3 ubiquitin-protein ligase LUL4 [Camelina sativa]
MGISFSNNNNNRRRDTNRRLLHHNHPPPPYYYLDPPPPPPPFPPHYDYNYHLSQPLPPQPQINSCSYGHYHYYPQPPQYFTTAHPNWWGGPMTRPAYYGPPHPQTQTQPLPPPYVEQQNAKKVRNDVNVHRGTVRLEVDDLVPRHLLVSFVFDALFDGSFTITFFAKEEQNCTFVPQFPEVYSPARFHFQKGPGQKFLQPSGTGTDLSFFALDDLSKPFQEDVYPLVISAETVISPNPISEQSSVHKQVTQAVLEKGNDGSFKVKVVKQILWIEGVRYELRELYGSTTQGAASGLEDSGSGKECVICMTEAMDTAVLPCRHLCMCSDCAKELRLQSNKCPICRQPIEELLEIKVNSSDEQH